MRLFSLLKRRNDFIAFRMFRCSREHIANFFCAQWFLRGEQQSFQNKFQFHLKQFEYRVAPTATVQSHWLAMSGSQPAAACALIQFRRTFPVARKRSVSNESTPATPEKSLPLPCGW